MSPLAQIMADGQAVLAASDRDAAIRSGREALDHGWGYPWYDPATDGVRRVDVKEPYSWDWLGDGNSDWFEGWDFSWVPFADGLHWPTTILAWIAWIVLAALVVALTVLLYRAYRRWAAQWDESDDRDTADDAQAADKKRVEALPFPVRQPRTDLREAARQAYQQGNYAEAIVYLFSYQLVQLDKHRLIRLTKGKTNRQYLREVGPRAAIGRLLEQTIVAFEDVFFGNHAIDRAKFDRCWARLAQFEAMLAETAR